MRYDEVGLNSLIVSQQKFIPRLAGQVPGIEVYPAESGVVWVGQSTDEPSFNFAKAAATAAGMLVFLLLGTGVAVLVTLVKGPLWGVATAALLGSGFYLYRDYELAEYRRIYGLNA